MNTNDERDITKERNSPGYVQAANLARLFSDPTRLELLNALAQSSRTVDSLAQVCDLPLKNVSHHLQKLLGAGLVDRVKLGRRAVYSIANDAVLSFWATLRQFTEELSVPTSQISLDLFGEGITTEHLARLLAHKRVVVIDVRPTEEFASGHLPGALSMPAKNLKNQIGKLPRGKPVVAFCRGAYCNMADQAVELLKKAGFEALRCADGIVEWRSTGMSVETGSARHERVVGTTPLS